MLLIEKLGLDRATLLETAHWYDLDAAVVAMYRALDGEFDAAAESPIPLPSEAEFAALKDQYGVS